MSLRRRNTVKGVRQVWLRYFAVFRKSWVYGLITTLTEPLLILAAFGFGVGGMIGSLTYAGVEMSYRQFVFAGIAAQAVLLQGFFEGAYGSFVRMYYQRIFQAIAVTPVTLSEVLWAEIIWDASRACLSATVVLFFGAALGDFSAWGALMALPLVVLGGLTFAALGVLCAGFSRTIEELGYPQYLVVIPMFLFCGVFFPLDRLPAVLAPFVWALPLTGLAECVRSVTLGTPFPWHGLAILLGWAAVLIPGARWSMTRRLIS